MVRRGRGGRNKGNGGQQGGQRGEQKTPQHRPAQNQSQSGASQQADRTSGKLTFQSALTPRKTLTRPPIDVGTAPRVANHTYKVIFFDTLNQAKSELQKIKELASQCDHLNIVVRSEANMDDPELTAAGKLFCGAAWALIHDRRVAEGWYDVPHE